MPCIAMDRKRFILLFICALNDASIRLVVGVYFGESDKTMIMAGSFLTVTSRSGIMCCSQCSQDVRCKTANFHKATGECQMVAVFPSNTSSSVISTPEWTMYTEGSCGGPGWVTHGSSCYKYFQREFWMTRTFIKHTCENLGADLWEVDEPGEWNFVIQNFPDDFGTTASLRFPIQITANSDESKGCMSEVTRQEVPNGLVKSVCYLNQPEEERCPVYAYGNLHSAHCGTRSQIGLCEKRQIN